MTYRSASDSPVSPAPRVNWEKIAPWGMGTVGLLVLAYLITLVVHCQMQSDRIDAMHCTESSAYKDNEHVCFGIGRVSIEGTNVMCRCPSWTTTRLP